MPKDYARLPRQELRRKDRGIEDEAWIRALLHRAPVAAIATLYEGQPFLNTNLFVYDEKAEAVYFHTARFGRTRVNVEAEEQACLSVYEMGRLLPAPTALEFSVEYASVVVFGRCTLIKDRQQAREALHVLLDKYAPHLERGRDYEGATEQELIRTAVYKLAIEDWSGKRKQVAADFPGAFFYDAPSVAGED